MCGSSACVSSFPSFSLFYPLYVAALLPQNAHSCCFPSPFFSPFSYLLLSARCVWQPSQTAVYSHFRQRSTAAVADTGCWFMAPLEYPAALLGGDRMAVSISAFRTTPYVPLNLLPTKWGRRSTSLPRRTAGGAAAITTAATAIYAPCAFSRAYQRGRLVCSCWFGG